MLIISPHPTFQNLSFLLPPLFRIYGFHLFTCNINNCPTPTLGKSQACMLAPPTLLPVDKCCQQLPTYDNNGTRSQLSTTYIDWVRSPILFTREAHYTFATQKASSLYKSEKVSSYRSLKQVELNLKT